MNRNSSSVSSMVRAFSSSRAMSASEKSTSCLRKFSFAFRGSQSNSNKLVQVESVYKSSYVYYHRLGRYLTNEMGALNCIRDVEFPSILRIINRKAINIRPIKAMGVLIGEVQGLTKYDCQKVFLRCRSMESCFFPQLIR